MGSISFLVRGEAFLSPSNVMVFPSSFLMISRMHRDREVDNNLDDTDTLLSIISFLSTPLFLKLTAYFFSKLFIFVFRFGRIFVYYKTQ